tara:strand:+ start:522 stop:1046 length:525 start_codon:yes stop_codon:yes gene_type:complete
MEEERIDEQEGFSEKVAKKILEEMEKEPEKGDKKFKLPGGITFGSKTKIKKGYVVVQLLRHNGSVDFKLLPTEDALVYIKDKGTSHNASAPYMWIFKKYPMLILPEWDLNPVTKKRLHDITKRDKSSAEDQKTLIRILEQVDTKKKLGISGNAIFWIIGAVGIGYVIFQAFTSP